MYRRLKQHACPACREPMIVDCWAMAVRVSWRRKRDSSTPCRKCGLSVRYSSTRSFALSCFRSLPLIVAVGAVVFFPTIVHEMWSIELWLLLCFLFITSIAVQVHDILRGTVVEVPGQNAVAPESRRLVKCPFAKLMRVIIMR